MLEVNCSKCGDEITGRKNKVNNPVCITCKEKRKREYHSSKSKEINAIRKNKLAEIRNSFNTTFEKNISIKKAYGKECIGCGSLMYNVDWKKQYCSGMCQREYHRKLCK